MCKERKIKLVSKIGDLDCIIDIPVPLAESKFNKECLETIQLINYGKNLNE